MSASNNLTDPLQRSDSSSRSLVADDGNSRAKDAIPQADIAATDKQPQGQDTSPTSCGETNPIINGFSLDTSYSPLNNDQKIKMIDGVIMNKTILKYDGTSLVEVSTPYNTCKKSSDQDTMKKNVTDYLLNVVINICNIIKENVFDKETSGTEEARKAEALAAKEKAAEALAAKEKSGNVVTDEEKEAVTKAVQEAAKILAAKEKAVELAGKYGLLKSIIGIGIPDEPDCRKIDVTVMPTDTDNQINTITINVTDYEPFVDNFNKDNCAIKIVNYLKNDVVKRIQGVTATTGALFGFNNNYKKPATIEQHLHNLLLSTEKLKSFDINTAFLDKSKQIEFITKTIEVLNKFIRYAHEYIYKKYTPSYEKLINGTKRSSEETIAESALKTLLDQLVEIIPIPKSKGGSNMNYSTPRKMRKTENRRFKNKRPKRKNTAKRYR
jgi:hypothetical protein